MDPKDIRKGMYVKVVKGRKVPLGTTGAIIWIGQGEYGWRVGLKDSKNQVHWTSVMNITPLVLQTRPIQSTPMGKTGTLIKYPPPMPK